MYRAIFKPVFDFIVALIVVLIFMPAFITVWILVYVKLGAPVIFRQLRPGKDEKLFRLYKFRTMNERYDFNGELLSDTERITDFGKFLRRTSLDELPQFFNILKGDLSLVGPRPLLIDYLTHYNKDQRNRHKVKPGITGWAQINGRNAITWEDKFRLDLFYVENLSLILDLKIIFITFLKVIKGSGIYNNDGVTMDKFGGSQS